MEKFDQNPNCLSANLKMVCCVSKIMQQTTSKDQIFLKNFFLMARRVGIIYISSFLTKQLTFCSQDIEAYMLLENTL